MMYDTKQPGTYEMKHVTAQISWIYLAVITLVDFHCIWTYVKHLQDVVEQCLMKILTKFYYFMLCTPTVLSACYKLAIILVTDAW